MLLYRSEILDDYVQSKGECLVEQYLSSRGFIYVKEVVFEKLPFLRYDFFVPNIKMLIEFNGKQHYKHVQDFDHGDISRLKARKRFDNIKCKFAYGNGLKLVKVSYKDIDNIDSYLDFKINEQLTKLKEN